MTTPHERRRNWVWGREMLQELAQDEALDLHHRTQAQELLTHYPSLELLQGLDKHEACLGSAVSLAHAEVLLNTRGLFERLQINRCTPEARRHSLRVILRHFW